MVLAKHEGGHSNDHRNLPALREDSGNDPESPEEHVVVTCIRPLSVRRDLNTGPVVSYQQRKSIRTGIDRPII